MPLRGTAALAMWWDMAPDMKAEFEDWHSHEHFPERLGVPGFHRASRWTSASGGEAVFVMYDLASHSRAPWSCSLGFSRRTRRGRLEHTGLLLGGQHGVQRQHVQRPGAFGLLRCQRPQREALQHTHER